MCDSRELIELTIEHTKDSIGFFSEKHKKEREQAVCRAFLRFLGIPFTESELGVRTDDPPDVCFRAARFEILEVLDKDRPRHQELKEFLKTLSGMKCDCELWQDLPDYQPLSVAQMVQLVESKSKLSPKARKYGPSLCSSLDALVYVNLRRTSLRPNGTLEAVSAIACQGWRSVSVVFAPFSYVCHAAPEAPDFLRCYVGQLRQKWKWPDTAFGS
jgi:Putative endonuclease, protein of unknown function (DUF1780)